jgi:hypothetical protein
LYYDSVIPFEHNDTIHLLEDGVYGVLLYDPLYDCGTTDTVHINVVGISDDFEQTFKLYPNPASDYLHIELQHEAHVTIFNTLGELMYQTRTQENTIPVSKFPNGLYFLRVEDGNKIETHPWIKH